MRFVTRSARARTGSKSKLYSFQTIVTGNRVLCVPGSDRTDLCRRLLVSSREEGEAAPRTTPRAFSRHTSRVRTVWQPLTIIMADTRKCFLFKVNLCLKTNILIVAPVSMHVSVPQRAAWCRWVQAVQAGRGRLTQSSPLMLGDYCDTYYPIYWFDALWLMVLHLSASKLSNGAS